MIGISSSIPKTNYVLMIVELVDELMKSIYQSCNLFLELIVLIIRVYTHKRLST